MVSGPFSFRGVQVKMIPFNSYAEADIWVLENTTEAVTVTYRGERFGSDREIRDGIFVSTWDGIDSKGNIVENNS